MRRESAQRVVPRCPHFGVCGGCKMQHLARRRAGRDQAARARGRALASRQGRPERVLRPIEGPAWGYRQRARLSVRHVAKKGKVLVGFHERKSSFVAEIASCDVVPRHVSELLLPLRALIAAMAARDRLPQIELAAGDARDRAGAAPPRAAGDGDLALLREFARAIASSGGSSRKGPRPRVRSTTRLRRSPTAARVRHPHAVSADRLHPGQPRDQRGAGLARPAAARAAPTSSSSTGSAASATSPCRWRRGPRGCSASKAAPR